MEADFIAETSLSSRNENVVICHGEQWYDVRGMTEKELEDFVADLLRARSSNCAQDRLCRISKRVRTQPPVNNIGD